MCIEEAPGRQGSPTVDTVKMGDPTQPVRGIVTTFLATHEVILRAQQRAANLIITHEPIFYNHYDATDWLSEDPVYLAKRKLIEDSGIVVWRYHDYWHARNPDGIVTGVLQHLGWTAYASSEDPRICVIPSTSLSALASFMKNRFGAQRVRVMGSPDLPCTRVGLIVGAAGGQSQIELVRDVDAIVVGEVREWETTEYIRDSTLIGQPRGLVAVGHALSEQPGMEYLAQWLTPRVPEVQVRHIPTGDPFRYQ